MNLQVSMSLTVISDTVIPLTDRSTSSARMGTKRRTISANELTVSVALLGYILPMGLEKDCRQGVGNENTQTYGR